MDHQCDAEKPSKVLQLAGNGPSRLADVPKRYSSQKHSPAQTLRLRCLRGTATGVDVTPKKLYWTELLRILDGILSM